MKHLFLLIIVLLGLMATSAQAASSAEGTGGGGEATPSAEQAITTEVHAPGEAHLYPTANAPTIGRVNPGDIVRVKEQLDRWYRIDVVERALGGPVIPLADGWVGEDAFGEPLDGVPPASRPTALPIATATASSSPSVAPTATATAIPFNLAPPPTATPPSAAGSDGGTIPGSAGGSARQPVLVSKPIIIYQCIDSNADRTCNVTEGIAGVTAYALNARTGEVLGQSVSNERGITQIYVSVLSDQQLVVDVPFLAHNETVRPTDDAITILNDDVAAIPGLLP